MPRPEEHLKQEREVGRSGVGRYGIHWLRAVGLKGVGIGRTAVWLRQ
jgi:hypothetical protein